MHITDFDNQIILEYSNGQSTIPKLCEKFNLSRLKIKRILELYNIPTHSRSSVDYSKQCLCNRRYNSIRLRMQDLEKYTNHEKLSFLVNSIRKLNYNIYINSLCNFLNFIDKFYYDNTFNNIYDNWIAHNKNTHYKPSLDHIIPLSKNGTHDLDNLMFLTWFENRAKESMTRDEWEIFKLENICESNLFI